MEHDKLQERILEIHISDKTSYLGILKISLAIKKMQIKTTMRYHYTSIRMTKITNHENTKHWPGCREIGTLTHWWWKCKMVHILWKTVYSFLNINILILNIYLLYGHQSHLWVSTLEKWKLLFIQKSWTWMFTAIVFIIANN